MISVYLDTNIFIYASDRSSRYRKSCVNLIIEGKKEDNLFLTSTETFQEIIHLSFTEKKLRNGITICRKFIKLVNEILPIDRNTINYYLSLLTKYSHLKNIESRDYIHAATYIQNNIDFYITYDKDFKKIGEIRSVTPEEFLSL